MDVARLKDLSPKIRLTSLDEVPRLLLEHRVLIGDCDKLVVTEALCVRNICEVWVPLLAEFTDDQGLVEVILLQERLGVVVAVDVNLGQGVVHGGILRSGLDPSLQPGKDQLEPVSLLDLVNQFVNREVSRDGSQETLDRCLVAVHIQQTTDNLRSPDGVHPLDVNFDELGQAVLVQVENQIVNKVEPIADDNKRKLVLEFSLLEEVLDLLRVVVVALSANTFDFSNLVGACGCLNILEVDFGVLAKVDDRSEIIVETCGYVSFRYMRVIAIAYLRSS